MKIPQALPDETLFSRLCRHFTMTGYSTEQYLKIFFGNHKISIHPFLNANLPRLSTYSASESALELRRTQTLIPLFSYYVSAHREEINDLSLSSDDLVRACQIVCFREHEALSLKFCAKCAKADVKKHGVTYWHRGHQIPGVEACHKHKTWLEHQALPPRPHIAKQFFPPENVKARKCTQLSYEFAKYSKRILDALTEGEKIEHNFAYELTERGYMTASGRLWRKRFSADMFAFISSLKYPVSTLLPNASDDLKYWTPIFKSSGNQHPFKHLLLNFWLESTPKNAKVKSLEIIKEDKSIIEKRCCVLLQQGNSMVEVSRLTGKSRCYIKHLALRKKIPVNLKPRVLTEELKAKIVKMAHKGFHRYAIAKKFNVSAGSVEMMISTTLGLVQWRQRCKEESMCRRYKAKIIRFTTTFSEALRKHIKVECSDAFFWLYLHEPKWLEKNLPEPTVIVYKNSVDWHQRDIELANVTTKLLDHQLHQISRTELDKALGGHGWLIKYKEKFPLTMTVVTQYLNCS